MQWISERIKSLSLQLHFLQEALHKLMSTDYASFLLITVFLTAFSEDQSCWDYLTYISGLPAAHCGQHIKRSKWVLKVMRGNEIYKNFLSRLLCNYTKYVQNHYLLLQQKIYALFVLKIVWKIFLCDRYLWKLYWETTFASGIVMFISNISVEVNVNVNQLSEKCIEF